MAKFDGILLATDWDGTFFSNNQLFDKNLEAIRYFQENGGSFTLCSGRAHSFLMNYYDRVKPNTYAICYGGGLIIDPDTNDVVYSGVCDEYALAIVDGILSDGINSITLSLENNVDPLVLSLDEYKLRRDELTALPTHKIVIRFKTECDALLAIDTCKSMDLRDYIAVRSWNVGLEFMKKENGKGFALRRVAEMIGARLTVAVGDYENDIQLLEYADIGYAVNNACPALKAVADRITVNVNESAIAKIIEDIEKEYCK